MNSNLSSDSTTAFSIDDSVTVKLDVKGMHCDSCVQAVEKALLQQVGVLSATVDLETETATVVCQANVDGGKLAQLLTEAGFSSQLQHSELPLASEPAHTAVTRTSVSWTLMGFFLLVVCFNICLNAQVLTVGLAYFYNPVWWKAHVWLVRSYSGLSLVLLFWVHCITVPRRIRSLTISLPLTLGLQYLTIHLKTPIPLAILHPLNGFALFSASTTLVHRVSRFLFPKADEGEA
ncbi:hypothetical protein HJG54_01295 [Leptolyngbya sp. NK1-12]|uniref:HMA domain-containing protein n=1 Tax=Leptolyngbya sp. NK1-12 TaxID=2547451 RepID=A0AA96WAR3_9CYAN|nr:hypothetical protein HJG54_01295 [Leptolyngbya sp. NK1-12]